MRYPKLRELREAITAIIRGPYTSRFPTEPFRPHPNFRGQPRFDAEHCVGCLACEEVCPVGAIAHEDRIDGDAPKRVMIHYTDTCIFCGQCEAACIVDHQGIRCTNQWELSFFDRKAAFETIEKDLQLCEMCGTVAGCRDHLQWVSQRLGELAFGNPTLYLARLEALGITDPLVARSFVEHGRGDRVKVLCARCRRKTTLTTAKCSNEHAASQSPAE